jgi:hypothetical protein
MQPFKELLLFTLNTQPKINYAQIKIKIDVCALAVVQILNHLVNLQKYKVYMLYNLSYLLLSLNLFY